MKKNLSVLFLIFAFPFHFVYSAPELKQEVVEQLTPKLNSDRIAYFFGSFGVDQIPIGPSPFQDCRIANLYSLHDGQKVMRTLAVVDYQQPVHESLKQVHQEICQGASIGIALRQHGWKLDKVPMYFGSVDLSSQVKAWMDEKKGDRAAVHIYMLMVFKNEGDQKLHYCTIIEVQSPQYLDENWLELLYPDQFKHHRNHTEEVGMLLDALNTLIQQFPNPS
ncbi:MAG: hypothetical protein JSR93_06145 [Verrucomicrobia bacterium]|nr:hypothetical protein [Verrucomicrobiota bacterium]